MIANICKQYCKSLNQAFFKTNIVNSKSGNGIIKGKTLQKKILNFPTSASIWSLDHTTTNETRLLIKIRVIKMFGIKCFLNYQGNWNNLNRNHENVGAVVRMMTIKSNGL